MAVDFETQWSQIVRRIGSHAPAEEASLRDELERLSYDVQEALFAGRPTTTESYSIAPDDRRLTILLDALEALSLLEPQDASYTWDQALVLKVTGRELEAARAYIETASRLEADARAGTGTTGDEADWAKAALAHAARCLIEGGQTASAAALLPRLDREDRAEIEPLVAAAAGA